MLFLLLVYFDKVCWRDILAKTYLPALRSNVYLYKSQASIFRMCINSPSPRITWRIQCLLTVRGGRFPQKKTLILDSVPCPTRNMTLNSADLSFKTNVILAGLVVHELWCTFVTLDSNQNSLTFVILKMSNGWVYKSRSESASPEQLNQIIVNRISKILHTSILNGLDH